MFCKLTYGFEENINYRAWKRTFESTRFILVPAWNIFVFGQDVYVSQSDSIESSIEVNSKGVTIYTLGLTFHLEDGTIIGDFAETFYYSEEAVEYTIDDFVGTFTMTGPSQFSGYDDAEMTVTITEGESANTLIITGVDYAEEIEATYDESA